MNGDFFGLRTRQIASRHLMLEFLADQGPRIVRVFLSGAKDNLFAELPGQVVETPYGPYTFHGGHRLWYAPEAFPDSYLPDDNGLIVEVVKDGVRLAEPVREHALVRKSIEIWLDPERPRVLLHHSVENISSEARELAPWAITQLPLGGVAMLPQRVDKIDPAGLLPNRNLVLWPYTSWNDSRLEFGQDWNLIHANDQPAPCKIGYLNQSGWAAYLRKGTLFVKRFHPEPVRRHPDLNCNCEAYSFNRFFELETLAPLSRLDPGQTASHDETWEFHTGLGQSSTPVDLEEIARELEL